MAETLRLEADVGLVRAVDIKAIRSKPHLYATHMTCGLHSSGESTFGQHSQLFAAVRS